LEEITVQKLECSKCGHYRIGIPEKIQELAEDWKCPSCYAKPGHLGVKMRTRCSTCNYTMLPGERKCHCPNDEPLFKVIIDPKQAWRTQTEAQKIQQEIKNAQAKRKFIDKSLARKMQDKNREVRMDANLQRIANALTKKEDTPKPKEMNNSAIQ